MNDAATIQNQDIRLEESWKAALGEEFSKPYMAKLKAFLKDRKGEGRRIFPWELSISAPLI